MNGNRYQKLAARTLISGPGDVGLDLSDQDVMLIWNAIGVAGEAGEICDLVKKGIFHQHGTDRDKIIEELGDLMWYIAALCTRLEIGLEDVMERNIEKLMKRYPEGYSSEDSINREVKKTVEKTVTITAQDMRDSWKNYVPGGEDWKIQVDGESDREYDDRIREKMNSDDPLYEPDPDLPYEDGEYDQEEFDEWDQA